MRQLYPTKDRNIPTLNKLDSFKLTEEQYNAILEALTNLNTAIQNTDNDLEQYKSLLRESITSTLAAFDNISVATKATIADAVISTIDSDSADIGSISATTIETAIIQSTQAVLNTARIDNLTSTSITTDTITGNTATFNEINATNANITNYNIENGSITNLSTDTANIDNATIDVLSATDVDADTAIIDEATITGLTATETNIADLYSEKIYNHYFNHNQDFNKQVVSDDSVSADGDYYIILPKFRNGTYYLIAKNGENGPYLWSMEIVNSVKNITFSWSVNSGYAYLQDVEVIEDSTDETQFIQIHCKTNSLATHIWHQCTDYNTQTPPSIYGTKQYDGTQQFEISQQKGNYMPNAVFVGDFHAEHLIVEDIQFDKVTVLKQIELASGYDAYGEPLGTTAGLANQYIKNIEVNGQIRTQWTNPAEEVERDNENLITSDTVSEYDGSIDNPDYDEDDPTSPEKLYPITHLGDDTVVHGDTEIEGELKTPNLQVSGETSSELDINSGIFIGNGPADISLAWLVKAVLNGVTTWYEIINNKHGYAYLVEIDTADYFDISYDYTVTSMFGPWATCTYNNMENLLMVMKPWTSGEPQEFARLMIMSELGSPRWKAPKLEDVEASLSNITQIADTVDPLTGHNSIIEFYNAKKAISGGFNTYRIKQFEGGIKADPLLAENSDVELEHGKPLIYNKLRAAAETSDELEIDKLTVDDLVADEVYTRDLHVTGHAYINDTVEEEVVGNYLTLRADNSSAMTANETSGILINNTDGNGNIVALVSDKDGTARIGDVTGTRTTYPKLYLKDSKYYTDSSYQTEVTPQGSMVSWDSKEELGDGAIYWTNAVFVVISSTLADLQPLLTRKEDVGMNDKGILIYDKTSHRSETIPLPDTDEQTLEAHVSSNSTVVFTDGTDFYDVSMSPTMEPEGTAGTPVSLGQFVYYNDTWFYYDGTDYYDSVDSWTDHTNYTLVHDDQSLIDALDAETKKTISSVVYTESPTISYRWKNKQAGSYVYATMTDYEADAANVPVGSQIIIEDETNYLEGQDM